MRLRHVILVLGTVLLTGLTPALLTLFSEGALGLYLLIATNFFAWTLVGLLYMGRTQMLRDVDSALRELGFASRGNDLGAKIRSFLAESGRLHRAAFAFQLDDSLVGAELSKSLNRIVYLAQSELKGVAAELALYDEESGLWSQAFISGSPSTMSTQAMLSSASIEEVTPDEEEPFVMTREVRFAGTLFGKLRVELPEGVTPTEADEKVLQLLATQGALMLIDSRFTDELLRMRLVSEESIKAKTGFLANLSHEIRGPLGVILNGVELTLDGLCGPVSDTQKQTLQMIKDNGDHLLDLVNDVLDYARVEAGKVSAKPVELGVKGLLKDLSTLVRSQAVLKKHKLRVEEIDESLGVVCDKRHIRQMLINLLTNAIKYTPDEGSIRVGAVRLPGGRIKIWVEDSGVGIPSSEQGKVFGAFERVDHKYSTAQVGTGLGMPLTKKLVEVNNGSVGFESEEGKGSTFWLNLPAVALETEDSQAQSEEEQQAPSLKGRGEHLLLVDHDEATRSMLERYLSHQGFQILSARSGADVLKVLRDKEVNLAVVENDMPDINGEDMVVAIRSNPRSKSVPIILLSSRAFVFDIERFLRLGVDRCLSKPVELSEIALTARQLIDESSAWPEDMQ